MKPQPTNLPVNTELFDSLIKSQVGSFVISTTAFIALISLIMASVWNFVSSRQQNIQMIKIRESRNTVITAAMRNSRTATYYYSTLTQDLPNNSDFKKCMIDDNLGSDCEAKSASGSRIEHFVTLMDETGNAVIGPDAAHPVFYDLYGSLCASISTECPFEVFGSYTVTCPNDAVQCAQAYEIEFKVQIQVSKSFPKSPSLLAPQVASQTIPISNFVSRFYPILPPSTPAGTPITEGSGAGGWIAQAYGGGSGGAPSSGGGAPASAPPPSAAPKTCKTGQSPSSTTSSCSAFNF